MKIGKLLVLCIALLMVGATAFAQIEELPDPAPEYEAGDITFVYYGEAETVVLAASFTGWNPTSEEYEMEYVEDGIFEITVFLPAGKHQYKYVIDGTWTSPIDILEDVEPIPSGAIDDGFGGMNSVLVVTDAVDVEDAEEVEEDS